MSRKPKAKSDGKGGYLPNKAKAKAGLNKAILDKSWHKVERYLSYKAQKYGKALFKVPAHFTSQECAACGHTHPDNRKLQSLFVCIMCGHSDNADRNAAFVIKQRAIRLIQYSGTELSKRGVLLAPGLDIGQGAESKSSKANALDAVGSELSKKKLDLLSAIPASDRSCLKLGCFSAE